MSDLQHAYETANERLRKLMPDDWDREPWPLAFMELTVDAALAALVDCPKCGGWGTLDCGHSGLVDSDECHHDADDCDRCDGQGWSPVVLGKGGRPQPESD